MKGWQKFMSKQGRAVKVNKEIQYKIQQHIKKSTRL